MKDETEAKEVEAHTPKVISLPQFEPPPRFSDYFKFAHEFKGEEIEDWDEVREIAREVNNVWWKSATFPSDVSLLRGVLLIQVRYARFIEGYPDESDMPYLDALVARIKESLSEISD